MTHSNRPIGDDDLQAYVDGRLAPGERTDVDQYLREHPQVAARVRAYAEQRDQLRARLEPKLREPLPARFRLSTVQAEMARRRRLRLRTMAAAAAWLCAGGVLGWTANDWIPHANVAARIPMEDALAAHRTFVDDVRHPVEVNASQSEHLQQWLSKRLGKPVAIPDLRAIALTFVGGRLLPTEEGPAAFLMYEDKAGKRVTFYVRPRTGSGTTPRRYVVRNGIGTVYWFIDGTGHAVTGGFDEGRLEAIADTVQAQSGSGF